jgi:hypothetical protein
MKKNSYYFSLLSEVEQEQYRENYDNLNDGKKPPFEEFLNEEFYSFGVFIMVGFDWSKTPSDQGEDYWVKISNRPEPSEDQTVLVQFIPTLEGIKTVLNGEKFKDGRCVYRGDHYYLINADEILDLILEIQKQK